MRKGMPIVAMLCVATAAVAAEPYAYPTKGQSQAQQDRDRSECRSWAMGQTGFDPNRPAQAAPAPPKRGGAVRGAAGGAAVGAIGGAIGGNAGKGAAIGAGVGAATGAVRQRRADKEAAAAGQQQYAASLDGWNRAYAACMTGRGYSVK